MKKLIVILALLIFASISVQAAVMTLQNAMEQNDNKPMAVLIYAQWADGYQNYLDEFKKVQKELANSYNFVELDIASKDAQLYNDNYLIYTKLPYVMLFRDNGKFSMLVNRDCASSASCISSKMKVFDRR